MCPVGTGECRSSCRSSRRRNCQLVAHDNGYAENRTDVPIREPVSIHRKDFSAGVLGERTRICAHQSCAESITQIRIAEHVHHGEAGSVRIAREQMRDIPRHPGLIILPVFDDLIQQDTNVTPRVGIVR